jgi:hypothetical protein
VAVPRADPSVRYQRTRNSQNADAFAPSRRDIANGAMHEWNIPEAFLELPQPALATMRGQHG